MLGCNLFGNEQFDLFHFHFQRSKSPENVAYDDGSVNEEYSTADGDKKYVSRIISHTSLRILH